MKAGAAVNVEDKKTKGVFSGGDDFHKNVVDLAF